MRYDSNEILEKEESCVQSNKMSYVERRSFLRPESTYFEKTEGNMLTVTTGGKKYYAIQLRSAFPLSNRRLFISVYDSENNEIGIIRNMDEFSVGVTKLLQQYLDICYFAPRIYKINKIKDLYWEVETDAGACSFTIKEGDGSLYIVNEKTLVILDREGNRFIISDIKELEPKEYSKIEIYL